MPSSRHELEIVARTKDLASGPLKSIGAEGQKAGGKVSKSLRGVQTESKKTVGEMLKIGDTSSKVTGVMGASFASVSAGLAAAQADAGNLEASLVSVGASVATAFATGGPIGAGIALLSVGIGALIGASKRAEKAEKERAAAAKRAAEETKKAAEARRQQVKAQEEYVESIEKEIRLLKARSDEERRSLENEYKRQEAYKAHGTAGYLIEVERQKQEEAHEAWKRDQEERKRIEEESTRRAEESARKNKERDRQLEQARKNALRLLEDQAEARFDALTMSSEDARQAADLQMIRELEAKGLHDVAKALKEALKYDQERTKEAKRKAEYDKGRKRQSDDRKKAADNAKRVADEARREAESKQRVVDALRDQLAIEKETTSEGRERVRHEQEIRDLRVEGGTEAVRLYKELMKLREDERKKTEEGLKREAALKKGENPNKGRKARRRQALHDRKQRREAAQRTGRSIEDSGMGPFGPFRLKEGGESPSRWMEMDRRKLEETYGDNTDDVLRSRDQIHGPDKPYKGTDPKKPARPTDLPTPVTPGDEGTPRDFRDSDFVPNMETAAEKLKFLEDVFGKSERHAAHIAEHSEGAAEAAEGYQGELETAEQNFTKMTDELGRGFDKLESFADATTEANTSTAKAVDRVGGKLDRLINQLKQNAVISGNV